MSEKVANFEGPCDLRGSAEPSARCGFDKRGQRVEGPRQCTYGGADPSTMWSSVWWYGPGREKVALSWHWKKFR